MVGTNMITLRGIRGIMAKSRALQDTAFARQMMGDIGVFLMGRIKKRTIAGDDVDGVSFEPYNPLYAKERAKAGFAKSPVDLTRSGSMLSAMTETHDRDSTEIFFMNTTDPTGARNAEKAFFLNEDREFFALSESDVRGTMEIVVDYYEKLMGRSTLR